ncbi:hypothetical protein J3R30DRAFT_3372705 [Lentinula aciculospora]|uniref:P-loop containing nucleoside triphosphate hydrolase protein n=1 Tax=Lentinula aciculospora TaxID=153920 RepID=A0A9W9ABU7_9AGAR|nr:hypothetical protein J3R30DRAFT_3372705 [Lentinula aciculospora]
MDLEGFEDGPAELHSATSAYTEAQLSPDVALHLLDDTWYTQATRRARWMDLIGDYGGKETFFIDGDSLFQLVFETPSLALGRCVEDTENQRVDNSFQLFHAKFILEKYLLEFTQRGTTFEVVFFNGVRHTSIGTDGSPFQRNSRALARKLLFHHISKIDIPVHSFESPNDPDWIDLVSKKQPMFIMANDGDTPVNAKADRYRLALLQRELLFELSRQGLAFALLKGAEYRDSKIMTFVFESRTSRQMLQLHPALLHAISLSHDELDQHLGYATPLSMLATQHPLEWWSAYLPDGDISSIFLLHASILPRIAVQLLARRLPVLHHELESLLQETFLPSVFRVLAQSDAIFPNVDGRLFLEVLWFIIQTKSTSVEQVFHLHQGADQELQFLSQTSFDGPGLATRYASPPNLVVATPSPQQYQLLPFSNPVFDTALANVHIPDISQINMEVPQSIFGMHILANDTKHWHNARSILPAYLGGQKAKPVNGWERRRRDRKEHRDQTRLQRQAASLTGASGNMLEKIIIAPVGSKSRNHKPVRLTGADETRAKIQQSKAKKNKKDADIKPIPLTGANKARAKILEDKSKKTESEAVEWWKGKLKAMKSDTAEEQVKYVDLLKRNPSPKATYPSVAFEIRLFQLHLLLTGWTTQSKPDVHRDDMVIKILRLLSEIKLLQVRPTIPNVAYKFLIDVCITIGFESLSGSLLPDVDLSLDSTCAFKPIKLISKKAPLYPFMAITSSPVEWQLEYFGEYMDRSMDSAPDRRVVFSPDRWQREVLDAIDRNESLLALAPTSAGKTFISFYAMEQVLRESDDGILVYVAPTKALVNQIAAEVYGRFSKNYPGTQTLLAVHTRDTRTGDLQRAQILITVPEMLGILILSPTLAQNWTSRVKRIILDEIHSIGQEQGGAVWEQIILLAPCPVIGLSATVGSPEQFNKWLESVQKAHSFPHVYIHHPHRYSHLRKYFFLPSSEKSSSGLLSGHKVSERLTFLHPISLLSDNSKTLPVDMALESRDCLSLYRALHSHTLLKGNDLSPDTFFKGRGLLCQKDILEYEKALKDVVVHVMTHEPSSMSKVISSLTPQTLSVPHVDLQPSRVGVKESLMTLVCDLHKLDNLPAILFSFDRTDCEVMAKLLTEKLESAETEWKKNSPKWKAKIAEVESWRKLEEVRSAQRQKEMKQKKDHDAPKEDTSSLAWQANFNEDDPFPEFSFAGRPPSVEELDNIIRELSSRWVNTPDWTIRALHRGIAVHHAGMSKAYRVAIENLFRQGFIRVMISTGTLALGINAPARTSVFCGDSPFLTALMYRQCAGRAGRRGFDLLGNVVFYGLPYSRVQRLVLSRLPALGDSFPLTSTFILRLFNLLQGSNYADFAVQSVKSVMNLPRISHRSDMGRDQVLHHVRFSIEYLRRAGLLNEEGKPTNLFGLTSHLFHTEPSNFALVHLFESGVIHNICGQSSSVKAETDLLLLLCHLFGRRYIPRNYSQPELIARLRKKYPSQIILPALSSDIGERLRQHNDDILRMFTSYALSYAAEHQLSLGIDDVFPLSGPATDIPPLESSFIDHLSETKMTPIARSVFAATSGLDDHFTSIYDLVSTVRKGIHLHAHVIPSMQKLVEHSDLPGLIQPEHKLNAYILDFYSHGQLSALAEANGMRRGDIWNELQEFSLTLKTIHSSLQELLLQLSLARNKEVKDVTELLNIGAQEEEENEIDDEGEDEEEGIEGFKRPPKTSSSDWRVYEMFDLITKNFDDKFHKIFA